jgi:membrane fusion protein, multidrug efflux system
VGSATPLAVITQMQPISVVFTVPEDELPAVMKRLRDGARLPVSAFDRSNTTKLADGQLSAVDSTIDPTTGTVKLRAEFANTDETLFPNQFVNARLLVDTLKGATVIPAASVQRGQPGTFVYVVKPDDTVSVHKITLGPQQGERVAVTAGLSPGDKIVVDGADKLREGAKIVLRQESGAAAPAAAAPASAAPPAAAAAPATPQRPARQGGGRQ